MLDCKGCEGFTVERGVKAARVTTGDGGRRVETDMAQFGRVETVTAQFGRVLGQWRTKSWETSAVI